MLSAVVTAKAQENCGFPGVAPGRVCPVTAHPGQTSAISPTECRICRSGCVHPDTVDSARHLSQASCDKTPSPRLQIMPYFEGCFVHLRCIYVAKLLAIYLVPSGAHSASGVDTLSAGASAGSVPGARQRAISAARTATLGSSIIIPWPPGTSM